MAQMLIRVNEEMDDALTRLVDRKIVIPTGLTEEQRHFIADVIIVANEAFKQWRK